VRRIILLIVLGVLVGGGVYEFLKTQKRPEEKPDLKLTADLEARGVTLMGQSDKGSWELKIGRLIYHLGEDLIEGEKVVLSLTLKDGRRIEAFSERGRAKRGGGDFVELEGNVRVKLGEWVLQAPFLRYDPSKGYLESPYPVNMEKADLSLRGKNLQVDLKEGKLRLGDVKIQIEGKG
jgi:LPS export ABC transporter protein LptC